MKNEPDHIAQSSDGSIWFSEPGIDEIGRIEPDGRVHSFPMPTAGSQPEYITAGRDGKMWFTEQSNRIGSIDGSGAVREYALSHRAYFKGIVSARDGSLWFSETDGRIGMMSSRGDIREFTIAMPANAIVPCPPAAPNCKEVDAWASRMRPSINGIAMGPDGNVWFGESGIGGSAIDRMSLDGRYVRFPLAKGTSAPEKLVAGFDGNLWFTEDDAQKIAKVSPAGKITEYPMPNYEDVRLATGDIDALTASGDGIWFAYAADRISRISYDGFLTTFFTNPLAGPRGIASSSDGQLWFSEPGVDKVAKMTHAGVITEFALPPGHKSASYCSANSVHLLDSEDRDRGTLRPTAITVNGDGSVWFVEAATGRIGVLNPAGGQLREYAVLSKDEIDPQSPVSPLSSIVHQSDGSIWFADGNMLGTVSRMGKIHEFRISPKRTKVTLRPGVAGTVIEEEWEGPGTVVTDRSDGLWFIESREAFKVDKKGNILKSIELAPGQRDDSVYGAAFDTEGALWFTQPFIDAIGKSPAEGEIQKYQLPRGSAPSDLAFDSTGNLWFETDLDVDVVSGPGELKQYAVGSAEDDFPSNVLPTNSGTWFTKTSSAIVGKITADGTCMQYALPHWNSDPSALAQGPDGSIWFTESGADAIGRIGANGKLTEFSLLRAARHR